MTAKFTFTAKAHSFFVDNRVSISVNLVVGSDGDRDDATDAEVRAAMEGSA